MTTQCSKAFRKEDHVQQTPNTFLVRCSIPEVTSGALVCLS
jgi:hypothetical protein